jgi:hypothetical protein
MKMQPTTEQLNNAGIGEEYHDKARALCSLLDFDPSEIRLTKYTHYDLSVLSVAGNEYAVGTDAESDDAWDQSLDGYIEECIEPELDFEKLGTIGNYVKFDREMWIRDAKMDGRGHSLSGYDGEENEINVNGVCFYVFRIS